MKRLTTLLLSVVLPVLAWAQKDDMILRDRIENVTEYKTLGTSHHNSAARVKRVLPGTGSPRIPVILVQFPDRQFTCDVKIDPSATHSDEMVHTLYDKFFNGERNGSFYTGTGSTGAVREYFIEVSDSIFQPEFKVLGPVTLSQSYKYYGKDQGSFKDVNISAMYSEACKLAMKNYEAGWDDCDKDNDGKVDIVLFVYAGEGQNYTRLADDIWPKESASQLTVKVDDLSVVFGAYACCNELYNGEMDGIGTFCHEMGHGLGLPDLYDTSSTGNNYGMDYWDLMDSGSYCKFAYQPVGFSAYERDFMGWMPLEEIALGTDTTIVLDPVAYHGKGLKLVSANNRDDYYVLENRQNKRYDGFLGLPTTGKSALGYSCEGKTHGLMVTHVQYSATAWNNNTVNVGTERLTIIPADGKKLSTTYASSMKEYFESVMGDLYPGFMNVTSFSLLGNNFEVEENEDLTITLKMNNGSSLDDAIGAVTISPEELDSESVYDLVGRKLDGVPVKSGIYIRGGKKFYVK